MPIPIQGNLGLDVTMSGNSLNTVNLTDPKIRSFLTKNAYTAMIPILIQGDLNFANTNILCLKIVTDTDTGITTHCNITTGTACWYLYGILVLANGSVSIQH